MTRDEAFLQTIVENPDDDAPRLIYADWLDEHSQPARAEFIRIQIELARLPNEEREQELDELEADLLTEHEAEWVGQAGEWLDGWRFHRGFLEAIRINPEELLERAPALFQAFPVHRLALVAPKRRALSKALAERLADLEQFTRLTDLDCSAVELTAAGMQPLLNCHHLTNLQVLNLSDPEERAGEEIGPAAVEALTEYIALDRLRELHLSGINLDDAALDVLVAAAPLLKRLRALNLYYNPITDAGIARLARSPHLRNLERLDLGMTGLGEKGLRALARSPHLGRLRTMHLGEVDIAPERLFRSPLLRRLSEINLGSTYPAVEDIRALLKATGRAPLRRLRLACDSLSPAALELLGTASQLSELTELDLSACDLAGVSLAPLLTTSGLPSLRHLDLSGNDLEDEAARSLAGWPGLVRLTTLNLGHNRLTRAGAEALTRAPGLAGLRVLSLAYNPIGSDGVQSLAASPYLMNLTDLSLGGTRWDAAGLRALVRSKLRGLSALGLDDDEGEPPARLLKALLASPALPRLQVIDLVRGGYQELPLHSRWRRRPQVLRRH